MSEKVSAVDKDCEPNIMLLCRNSIDLIKYTRDTSVKQINLIQLMTFYTLGKWIVEEQQNGENRAKYGQQVIVKLSKALNSCFGKGFSEDTLKNARKLVIPDKSIGPSDAALGGT